ncbi:bifunctional lysylphosphatidylglycerol synthetase/lysine--tRNA ligase LysX [Sinosporangium siamense]|uniref:Lysine--tRNA ligase n=2 Tax=Sinosporangium siamense TaxID=1367973 RepID=A0A919RAZ0_9ACTN|nr:bifunctional lysylphosphatidylglycerol synthetase/lysine--tRNA ligase LysX [Sinosporangium siamense]GII90177.1 lysine--tRNA ligase [Sinosporangium siamense]
MGRAQVYRVEPEAGGGHTARGERWSRFLSGVPRVLATILAVLAIYSAAITLVPPLRHFLRPFTEVFIFGVFTLEANLAYAVFMALLAGAVARRKRVAYWVLVALVVITLLADVVTIPVYLLVPELRSELPLRFLIASSFNIVLMTALLVVLIAAYSEFYARVQHASFRKAVSTVIALLLVSFTVGLLLVTFFPGTLPVHEHITWVLEKALGGAISFDFDATGQPPHWVSFLIGLFSATALVAGFIVLFRSQRAHAVLDPQNESRIRALLTEHGECDSLGYFATRRDRAAIFSASGKAAVSYRVVAGVSLAGGDPLGDPEAWPPAIEAFLDQAKVHGWTAAVVGAGEEGARAYDRSGLHVLQIGDEAVLDVGTFSIDRRGMRAVRQAVNRVERAGYTLRVRRHSDLAPQEMRRVIDRARAWRGAETERGFSMALGRLGDPADGRCVLVEALTAEGDEAAILSFVPWGRTGLSLDLMRRDRLSDNGLIEFMVAGLVERAPALGVDRVSLNFAVFRSVFEEGARMGAGPVLRAWRRTLLFVSRWLQLESIYRSNVKYRPLWVPRYLAYGEIRDLPKVGIALAAAEGFLPSSLRTLLHRGEAGAEARAGVRAGRAEAAPIAFTEAPTEIPAGTPVDSSAATPEIRAAPQAEVPLAASEQSRVRLRKLSEVADPYPPMFPRTHTCAEVRRRHAGLDPDQATGEEVAVAGRVMLVRDHGRVMFATIADWSGDLQLMLTDPDLLSSWRRTVDLGDHVGCRGEVVTTRAGEISVRAAECVITAKCLHPLPRAHHDLSGAEAGARRRYLDLVVRPEAREMLRVRSTVLHALRGALAGRGFLEVETPMLQPLHGGALARAFTTHINVYDMALQLRIAPELYLKRLCVGGVEKVFELGRSFRNEGVSYRHNPEFTMLEAYQAYADYGTMLTLTRELIQQAATAVYGSPVVLREHTSTDISGEWPVVTVYNAISAAAGEEITPDTPADELLVIAERLDVPLERHWGRGAVVLELYERLVEERTVNPTFYIDFPVETSPLARPHRGDPRLAERWDLVAYGTEIATAYSELTDPLEQRRRLTEQSLRAAGGDPEAMRLDEDFLFALEHAMPPTGGLGLGVDRLVMFLTGASIRQTLTFPLVRLGPLHLR